MVAEGRAAPPGALELLLEDPEATEALGERLGRALEAGDLVLLDGELGSGKTTLVRGLARGLQVESPVRSPTYTLMACHEGRLPLFHFDAYLEGRERALLDEAGLEALSGAGVAVVEWGERVLDLCPPTRLRIALSHAGPARRRLLAWVEGRGAAAERLRALVRGLAEPPAAPGVQPAR
jgi:tRNA threonylcarbamoyladenosine biosynthesis protein TsaE